jgi:hypothetical protein
MAIATVIMQQRKQSPAGFADLPSFFFVGSPSSEEAGVKPSDSMVSCGH